MPRHIADLVVILAGLALIAAGVAANRLEHRRRQRARERRRAEARAFLAENARQLALAPLSLSVDDDGNILSEPRT